MTSQKDKRTYCNRNNLECQFKTILYRSLVVIETKLSFYAKWVCSWNWRTFGTTGQNIKIIPYFKKSVLMKVFKFLPVLLIILFHKKLYRKVVFSLIRKLNQTFIKSNIRQIIHNYNIFYLRLFSMLSLKIEM